MNRNGIFYLKRGSFILFITIVVIYSLFQTRNILFGPSIEIVSPINGETYNDPLLEVKGTAKSVKFLTLNDRPLFTDTNGNFEEKLLLAPGYNILKIEGTDKFGKKTKKILEIILKDNQKIISPPKTITSTSTETISTSTKETDTTN